MIRIWVLGFRVWGLGFRVCSATIDCLVADNFGDMVGLCHKLSAS